jgi:hypothetical protein
MIAGIFPAIELNAPHVTVRCGRNWNRRGRLQNHAANVFIVHPMTRYATIRDLTKERLRSANTGRCYKLRGLQ